MAISLALHVAAGALLFVGLRHVQPNNVPAAAVMAVTIVAEPAAPPVPAHQAPVGPQKVQTPPQRQVEKPVEDMPKAPVVPQVHADVVVPQQPKKPDPTPSPAKPKPAVDTTTAPSAPPLPPKPMAGAPLQGVSSATANKAEQTWDGLILSKLEKKKRYPGEAQRAGQQDTVYVDITVDRTGHVIDSAIDHSKHFPLLDSAVLDLVKRCNPLPAPPASVPGDQIKLLVPVNFFIDPTHH